MTIQEGIIEATSCCSKIVTHQGVFFDVSVSVLDLQDNPSQVYTFIEYNAIIIDQFDRLSASVTLPYLHSHHHRRRKGGLQSPPNILGLVLVDI